jgi:hypothetical protein
VANDEIKLEFVKPKQEQPELVIDANPTPGEP